MIGVAVWLALIIDAGFVIWLVCDLVSAFRNWEAKLWSLR